MVYHAKSSIVTHTSGGPMPFAPVGTPAPPSRALPRMAIALLACLALYGIDLACMATVPAAGFDFAGMEPF